MDAESVLRFPLPDRNQVEALTGPAIGGFEAAADTKAPTQYLPLLERVLGRESASQLPAMLGLPANASHEQLAEAADRLGAEILEILLDGRTSPGASTPRAGFEAAEGLDLGKYLMRSGSATLRRAVGRRNGG